MNFVKVFAIVRHSVIQRKKVIYPLNQNTFLTNDYDFMLQGLKNEKDFLMAIGSVYGSLFCDNNFYINIIIPGNLFKIDFNVTELDPVAKKEYISICQSFYSLANYYLCNFWFVNDSPFSLGPGLCVPEHGNGHTVILTSSNSVTSADCKKEISVIDESLIEKWKEYLNMDFIKKIIPSTGQNYINTESTGFHGGTILRKSTRLQRSNNFILDARKSNHFFAKIAYYVAALECLFTTSKTEVTHKVTERCAIYMGNSPAERHQYFKLIKDAYNIRSIYMHGQSFKEKEFTEDKLKEFSFKMDSLLRKVLLKIINNDYELFIGEELKLNDYFKSLLLGTIEKPETE